MQQNMHVYSGEWTGHGPCGEAFSVGYVGKCGGYDSHGFAVPLFPAEVVSAIIDEQRHMIASNPDAAWTESLEWGTGDEAGAVVVTWLDPSHPARNVIRPDAQGLYRVGEGWTWAKVDAFDCHTVVTPDALQSFVTVHHTPVGRVHGEALGSFDDACQLARDDVDRHGEMVVVVGLHVDWATFDDSADRWQLIDAGERLGALEP